MGYFQNIFKGFIFKGFQKSLHAFRTHKLLFTALFLLQLFFIISITFTALYYQLKVIQDLQGIIGPLQTANYDPARLQQGEAFSTELSSIRLSYASIKKNIFLFVLLNSLLFFIINGLLWVFCHYMLYKKKNILSQWLRFVSISILLIIPYLFLAYFILKEKFTSGVDPSLFAQTAQYFLYGFGVIYYFLLISFAYLSVNTWKDFFSKIFTTGVKKIHYTLPALALCIIPLALSIFLMSIAPPSSYYIPLILIFLVIMIFTLTFSKIFWIASLQELDHETHHP